VFHVDCKSPRCQVGGRKCSSGSSTDASKWAERGVHRKIFGEQLDAAVYATGQTSGTSHRSRKRVVFDHRGREGGTRRPAGRRRRGTGGPGQALGAVPQQPEGTGHRLPAAFQKKTFLRKSRLRRRVFRKIDILTQ
jgi:hypothetical protein